MDLTTLVPEVFETVLAYLDLDSVKALRLTSRQLAEKCIGPRFLGCIEQPVFDVSFHNLRSLYALACNPSLSKVINSLTFLATSLDTSELEKNIKSGTYTVRETTGVFVSASTVEYSPEELSNAKDDLNWLNEQQKERANESSSEMIDLIQLALNRFGALDSIHLEGAVITGRTERGSTLKGEWHPLWMRASHVFSLVVTAMAQGGASVREFDAYRTTPRCCIPSGLITSYVSGLNREQLDTLGKRLEVVRISTSAEVQGASDTTEPDEDNLSDYEKAHRFTFGSSKGHLSYKDPRAVLSDQTPGIALFLKSAPALRELDLSFRHTLEDGFLNSYDRIVESIACEAQFPALEECALAGFHAKGKSILLFLENHPNIRSFTLRQCTLTTGSWLPIFSHLTHSMPRLETANFSNLDKRLTKNMKNTSSDSDEEDDDDEEEEDQTQEEIEQEPDGPVNLHPLWDTERPSRQTSLPKGSWRFVHTRSFNREELKKGIVFKPVPRGGGGRTLGSPELMWWRQAMQAEFGLP